MCFSYFRRILQVFYLDVTKVDLVLLMLQWDPSIAATRWKEEDLVIST
jgi:hypothetical protein